MEGTMTASSDSARQVRAIRAPRFGRRVLVIVDDINALVVWSWRPGAEGCENTNPSAVQVIPLKP